MHRSTIAAARAALASLIGATLMLVFAGGCQLVAGSDDFTFSANGGSGGGAGAGGSAACMSPSDCPGADFCDNGSCVPKRALGEPCNDAVQCGSGQCPADGLCCDAACDGSCVACKQADTGVADGSCAPILIGTDPARECADSDPVSCGANGTGCNGDALAPACLQYDGSTECGSPYCDMNVQFEVQSCDGLGNCVAAATTQCSPYTCDDVGLACKSSCINDADCIAGHYCGAGACLPKKANGDSCGAPNQCQSGFCPAEGVCCNVACDGACKSCLAIYTPAQDGTCDNIVSGQDPYNECLLIASCNGNGGCG